VRSLISPRIRPFLISEVTSIASIDRPDYRTCARRTVFVSYDDHFRISLSRSTSSCKNRRDEPIIGAFRSFLHLGRTHSDILQLCRCAGAPSRGSVQLAVQPAVQLAAKLAVRGEWWTPVIPFFFMFSHFLCSFSQSLAHIFCDRWGSRGKVSYAHATSLNHRPHLLTTTVMKSL
jgi:hypothetical protein